ncbi:uncharacterized protein LOC114933122 [Nylanderia fulva]|uniref:uncharacterized protein LOC114933122 n=1 Tax=Nylanderia fulva TaxID=613905 RepID=UPI0010FBB2B4|nr:uncharacterized protein LOC114933122 [Nylanderia fulva]
MEIAEEESCSSYPPCVPSNKTSSVFNHDITEYLRKHMRSKHLAIYNNSETKWTHSKIDHKFKCNYCDNTYEPAYRIDKMLNHINNRHKLNKEIANKFQTWVIDQLSIPKCEICKQFSKYHAFIFMIHLHKVHDVIVPQEFIPQRLSNGLNNHFEFYKNVENIPTSTSNNHQQPSILRTYFKDYDPTFNSSDSYEGYCHSMPSTNETSSSREWLWHYFTIYNGEFIKCNICFLVFNHYLERNLMRHMNNKHLKIYKNSKTKWTHSKIDHKFKCNYCDNTYEPAYRTDKMLNHINNTHKLNKEIANKLQTWVIDQLSIPKCEICKQFSKYHAFIFMIHLHEVHDVIVHQEFIPQSLPFRLENLFYPSKNVENIPTSTSNNHQQPSILRTYFKDYDPTFNSSDTFELSNTLVNLLSSDNDTATSSSNNQQPSILGTHDENLYSNFGSDNLYQKVCHSKSSTNELSNTLNNPLSSGNDTATSSSNNQQPSILGTHDENLYSNFGSDNLYQKVCHSKSSTNELSNTLNNPLSSGNDTATSSSNNQQPSILGTHDENLYSNFGSDNLYQKVCHSKSSTNESSNTSGNLLSSGNDTATSSSFYQSIVSTDFTDSEKFVDLCDREVKMFLECDKEESYSIIPFDKY